MSAKVHSIMKELHRQLRALYGSRLVRMVLYGSQSRGDAERGSDIDVLVVLEGPVSPGVEIAEPVTSSPRSLSYARRGALARICFVRSVRA